DEWIRAKDFDPQIQDATKGSSASDVLYSGTLREMEKNLILERLREFDGNVVRTAQSLGLTRHGLYSKMRRYRVTPKGNLKKTTSGVDKNNT
ncbi:MAG TPA: helix-turn-helix domain-containing protein, partial [Candidatus Hodarchaeales archaeon]|nr:helix-turn-helix domain-containing protein [Candidatus Hodarchaeales archaeon]